MKVATRIVAQGDCLFVRVGKLPGDTVLDPAAGRIVVAHSETGHDHVAESRSARLHHAKGDPLTDYLVFGDTDVVGIDIVHLRSWDTHETVRLLGQPGDVWQVRRQREWTPEGWRRVED